MLVHNRLTLQPCCHSSVLHHALCEPHTTYHMAPGLGTYTFIFVIHFID